MKNPFYLYLALACLAALFILFNRRARTLALLLTVVALTVSLFMLFGR